MMNGILGIIVFFITPLSFLVFALLQGLDVVSDGTAHKGKAAAAWSFFLFLFVLLYRVTFNLLFILLLITTIGLLIWTLINKYYMRTRRKPSTPDAWICRKCGNENSNLITECNKCKNKNPSQK